MHSYYSFRYGVRSLQQWVDTALQRGDTHLTLTDVNHTGAALDFLRLCGERGLQGSVGAHIKNGPHSLYFLVAQHNEGFAAINRFLARHRHTRQPFPARAPFGKGVLVLYPLQQAPPLPLRENEYLSVAVAELAQMQLRQKKLPLHRVVAAQPAVFTGKKDFNAHRLLRAIDCNCLLSKLPPEQQAPQQHQYYSAAALRQMWQHFPQALQRSQALLESCAVQFEFKNHRRSQNKKHFLGSAFADKARIEKLCQEGLLRRYPTLTPTVEQRLKRELEVIESQHFFSYFLINHDIVEYAQRRQYFHVGRGSGANSLVAYLLGITDVDPIELNLYFERFMNHSRQQPPDFDIDFSWRDREDITRYIFKKHPTATLLGAYNTFKFRAATRELGKVLGLPPREIEALSQGRRPASAPGENDEMGTLVLRYGKMIEGFPNLPTVHSSGILIPEKNIEHFGSTWLPPKGFPTAHFDMYAAEDAGLHKFDILGQRGLGKIKDALRIVAQNQPEAKLADIHDVKPLWRDPKIKSLLREGRTMGCFYVESPAMRGLLRKLHADTYIGLVAASSIIRPGVSQSGMMQEYIRRFRQPELRQYIHPRLGEILAETYGVMVYQEDVLKVAHYFAGLSLEEADVLRRGMSWKFRERSAFDKVKEKFFSNCLQKGYQPAVTAEVWRQIESFGNYAFAKGHSASYAVESYQSLYLKAYFPLEYLVATVNNGGGFYSAEIYLQEARRQGGIIEAPCINRSDWECVLQGAHLFLGLFMIKDLEQSIAEALLRERGQNGAFASLAQFTERVAVSLEQMLLLVRTGAFRFTGSSKKELLWEAHFLLRPGQKSAPVPELFRSAPVDLSLPTLETATHEDALDEMELLGFPLCSPFDLLENPPANLVTAQDLPHNVGHTVRLLGYLVHVKSLITRGKTARPMQFGTFTDRAGDFIDTVHFPDVAARYSFKGKGLYLIVGTVQEEYDFVSVELQYMEKVGFDVGC